MARKKASKGRVGSEALANASQAAWSARSDTIRQSLLDKMHPSRIRLSGRMRAIIDYILGSEKYTNPYIVGISVTSDGFVIVQPATHDGMLHDEMIGTSDDLLTNVAGVARAAGLTQQEINYLTEIYSERVQHFDEVDIEAEIARLLGVSLGSNPSNIKIRQTITKLREVRVDRNATPDEAATAARIADELEEKLR